MRFRLFIGLFLAITVIAACQGPPPTVVYIVVTATPETAEATLEATELPAAITETSSVTEAVAALPSATATLEQPSATIPPLASETATTAPATTPAPTDLPPSFPTPVIQSVQVAEELYEHGRMFWVGPIQQIWVLKITGEGHGTWEVYEDTYVDGEPETDPSLVPPDGRYQPERGFGKLWRESPGLRDILGWGVTPEFGYVSNYEYHAGGSVDASGQYVPGPGYHILYSLAGEKFRFNEADATWQLGNG